MEQWARQEHTLSASKMDHYVPRAFRDSEYRYIKTELLDMINRLNKGSILVIVHTNTHIKLNTGVGVYTCISIYRMFVWYT